MNSIQSETHWEARLELVDDENGLREEEEREGERERGEGETKEKRRRKEEEGRQHGQEKEKLKKGWTLHVIKSHGKRRRPRKKKSKKSHLDSIGRKNLMVDTLVKTRATRVR